MVPQNQGGTYIYEGGGECAGDPKDMPGGLAFLETWRVQNIVYRSRRLDFGFLGGRVVVGSALAAFSRWRGGAGLARRRGGRCVSGLVL
jgi:hypothetical protein